MNTSDKKETTTVLLDTNILASALGWPRGKVGRLFKLLLTDPGYEIYISQQVLKELEDLFQSKFLKYYKNFERFRDTVIGEYIFLLPDAIEEVEDEHLIPDAADRLIYRTAVKSGLDFLLTSDKKFAHSGAAQVELVMIPDFLKKKRVRL